MPNPDAAVVRVYASPTLVLLGMDWPAGAKHADFLGFSILRSPGYGKTGAPQFLFNKLDFVPLKKGDKPRTSDRAPIQKFQWWDGGIGPKDAGKHFRYTVTPIRGTGAQDLHPVDAAAVTVEAVVPASVVGGIGTWFNRAVVSSQSYAAIKNKPLLDAHDLACQRHRARRARLPRKHQALRLRHLSSDRQVENHAGHEEIRGPIRCRLFFREAVSEGQRRGWLQPARGRAPANVEASFFTNARISAR